MSSKTVPIFRYMDAKAAIDWLCDVIGFEVFLAVPEEDGRIKHARLILGDSMIMLASHGREGDFDSQLGTPSSLGGVTQATSLIVDNPDSIYQRVLNSSAVVVQELEAFEFGGKTFSFEDIESHLWVVSSHDPWIKTW